MNRVIFRRTSALALAAALTLSAAACGKKEPAESTAKPSPSTSATTTTTAKPLEKNAVNPLTGKEDMATANNRPVGFVITDEDSKHMQINIDKADMYFEAETESGIPRMIAIFASIDRIPDEIGPVRSARMHFVKFAHSLDMMYGHIGGSPTGLSTIASLGVDDFSPISKKNPALINSSNHSWNVSTFQKENVAQNIQAKKHALTTKYTSPFTFGKETGSTAATTVDVKISNSYNMAFTYNADKGVYQKHRNSLNTPVHIAYAADGSAGNPVEVSNVIVMFDKRSNFTDSSNGKAYVDFELTAGTGLIASGGTSRSITWKNDAAGLKFYETDGTTPLTVAVGKTFVCLTSDTLKNKTTVK